MSKAGGPPQAVNMAVLESMRQAEHNRHSEATSHPSSAEGHLPTGGVHFPGVGSSSIDAHHNLGNAAINIGTDGEGIPLGVFNPPSGGGFFEQSIFEFLDGSNSLVPGITHELAGGIKIENANLFHHEITNSPKFTALPAPHNADHHH